MAVDVIVYYDSSVCIAAHLGCTYSSSLLLFWVKTSQFISYFAVHSFIEYLSVLGARDIAVNETEKLLPSGSLHFESQPLNNKKQYQLGGKFYGVK